MKLLSWSLALPALLGACTFGNGVTVTREDQVDVYAQKVHTLEGEPISLEGYRGKVSLVVNTASKCGYTPQYEGLQALYEKYKDRDFVVLGFPSNDFMGQEPGTSAEIRAFCTENFGVTFPMFEKVKVKEGEGQSELYKLMGQASGSLPSWNFGKYLVSKDGQVLHFFGTRVKPQDQEVITALEAALAGKETAMLASSVKRDGPHIELDSNYADFPATLDAQGKILQLNGSALCEWGLLGFNLYRGALYVERPSHDPEALLAFDQTMLVHLHFVRSLSTDQLQEAFRASAHFQVGTDSPLEGDLQTLLGWMQDVSKGDSLSFVADPKDGLHGYRGGQNLGSIANPEFAKLFVRLYLGNKPPTEALKRGMLGL